MRVVLGGEGPDELGSWARHPSYRDPYQAGIIEALLRRVSAVEWRIESAVVWKSIRKFRVGKGLHGAELRNVLGLALQAWEAGSTVVAFTRDRDRDPEREDDVERGIVEARELFPQLTIIGGVAAESIDAWVLACLGVLGSEELTDPKAKLAERGVTNCAGKVDAIAGSDLADLPRDARSLRQWLDRARAVPIIPPDSRT